MLNVPNTITLLRLLAVPPLVWLCYSRTTSGLVAAGAFLACAAASDWLDGYWARRHGASSRLGTLVDPIVDKTMILCVLFALADRGAFPIWLVLLSMFREFAVTAVRHEASAGRTAVGANWMGKAKFCMQVCVAELAIVQLVLENGGRSLPGGRPLLFWVLLVVTILSYGFLVRFARQVQDA